MGEKFVMEGLSDLGEGLKQFSKSMTPAILKRTLISAAEPMVDAAQGYAPKLTGALEISIAISDKLTRKQRRSSRKQSTVEVYVGPEAVTNIHQRMKHRKWRQHKGQWGFVGHDGVQDVPVVTQVLEAIPQEFGTSKMAARPYMRPAWDETKMDVMFNIQTDLGAEMSKAAEKIAAKQARLIAQVKA